jgi:hypothetical protein
MNLAAKVVAAAALLGGGYLLFGYDACGTLQERRRREAGARARAAVGKLLGGGRVARSASRVAGGLAQRAAMPVAAWETEGMTRPECFVELLRR